MIKKLGLDITRPNYVIMRGDVIVSGVFTNYSNALKEMYRRIWRCKHSELPDNPNPPFKLVEMCVSVITKNIEGEIPDEEIKEEME